MKVFALTAEGVERIGRDYHIPMTHLYDRQYYYISLNDWVLVIRECRKDFPVYEADSRDCDNFAGWLNSGVAQKHGLNTMGLVRVPGHALNLFPAERDGKVYLYYCEPQTGEITAFADYPVRPLEWWMF
jgi:hypothetical protein